MTAPDADEQFVAASACFRRGGSGFKAYSAGSVEV